MKTVLDVCCGAKACWFQPDFPDAEFCDIREEEVPLCDGRISIRLTCCMRGLDPG